MEPAKIQTIREQAKGRAILELVEDIAAQSNYPVKVYCLAGNDQGEIKIYLAQDDYRLYQEAMKGQ